MNPIIIIKTNGFDNQDAEKDEQNIIQNAAGVTMQHASLCCYVNMG